MNRNTLIALGLVAVFFIYKFAKGKMMAAQLKKLPEGSYLLLDVRSPEETAGGMLKGAFNIPLDDLPARVSTLDKGKPVYVYCASGSRSAHAVSMLKSSGFQAFNLGGYSSLRDS